jgi:uncharacterized membrane protein
MVFCSFLSNFKDQFNQVQLTTPQKRIQSVDVLRGIVMIIMALDHTRDFFHNDAITHDPLDLTTTTPILFFTRWITHFCAPTFVFLSGVSAALSSRRKTKKEASGFLVKRGVWLLFVEIVIMSMGFTFNPSYNVVILQVIWVIGWGMILTGLLMRISTKAILWTGILIVFGHDLFNYLTLPKSGIGTDLANIFFTAKFYIVPLSSRHVAIVLYAIMPWAGLMMLGYAASAWFVNYTPDRRRKILATAGLCVTALFIILRLINQYGDPAPYSPQRTFGYTLLSFVNANKYPPSLQYMCMTIGPALLLLALLEYRKNIFSSFAKIYGQVPFFYYVLHFYILHTLLVISFYASGYGTGDITPKSSPFLFRPDNSGYSLGIVYLIWAGVVLILYFPCRWYSRYKLSHKEKWWLHYL